MLAFVGTFTILYFLMIVLEKDVRCRYCRGFKPVYLDDQGICPKCSQRRVCSKCKCRRQAHYYISKDAEVCYFCLLPPSNTRSSVQNLFQEQPLHHTGRGYDDSFAPKHHCRQCGSSCCRTGVRLLHALLSLLLNLFSVHTSNTS